MMAFPVPAPADAPQWIGVLLVIGAVAVLVVLVWQAVRFFRSGGPGDSGE